MKQIIIAVCMLSGLTTQANVQQPADAQSLLRGAWQVIKVISQGLEQVRLYSHANMNIQQQWDLACDVTKTLNPSLLELNKLLTEHKVNQKLGCAPITPLIKYQTEIIAQCNQFYTRPVPDSARLMLGKFALTVFQSKLIMTKCYPELAKVRLPIPSFD